MLVQRFSKRLALVGVLQSVFVSSPSEARRVGGDVGAAHVKGLHGVHPSTRFASADEVVLRDAHVVEGQRAGIGTSLTHVGFFLAEFKARRAGLHHEPRHASVTCVRIGFGENEEEISVTRTGDPHLGAVEDVFIAVLDGRGFACCHVRTGTGLGHTVGSQRTVFGHLPQPNVLLFFRCSSHDGGAGQRCGIGCRGETRVAPSQLLVHENFFHGTQASPTVFLGDVEVQQPHLMGQLNRLLWVMRRFVPVLRMGPDFIHGEFVGQFLEHHLDFIELEVHHALAKRPPFMSD